MPLYNFNGGDDGDGPWGVVIGPGGSRGTTVSGGSGYLSTGFSLSRLHHSATQFCVRGPRHNCTSSLASQMMARFLGTPTSFRPAGQHLWNDNRWRVGIVLRIVRVRYGVRAFEE